MAVITIPFDFSEDDRSVVPICVSDKDTHGNTINRAWIYALEAVADPMRSLARFWLEDVWRSSELADETIQHVWRLHGDDLGECPSGRVYSTAKWKAVRKRLGRRERKEVDPEVLECLPDPYDFVTDIERRERIETLLSRLKLQNKAEQAHIIELFLQDYQPQEIAQQLGKSRNAIYKQLLSGLRKAHANQDREARKRNILNAIMTFTNERGLPGKRTASAQERVAGSRPQRIPQS
jgi:RNA polymerase sigma factor (sigma-70 family)